QAEDGIRDRTVTGVQTCALPILMTPRDGAVPAPNQGSPAPDFGGFVPAAASPAGGYPVQAVPNYGQQQVPYPGYPPVGTPNAVRSEERRVGEEGGSGGGGGDCAA